MLTLLNSPLGFATTPHEPNPCEGMKYQSSLNAVAGEAGKPLPNIPCFEDDGDVSALPQAGADVTKGSIVGGIDSTGMPALQVDMETKGLCAVNVHWHEGAEHRSAGEYDETFDGPGLGNEGYHGPKYDDKEGRKLAADKPQTQGHHCKHYASMTDDQKKPYEWKYCKNMHVGETYEIHWPHSAAGSCGTKWQYQTPFYDGVLCNDEAVVSVYNADNTLQIMAQYVGVEGQVFTVVNDDAYDMDLNMGGAIKDADHGLWTDVAMYTGSTTGQSRDNDGYCSQYTPITWQVDRKCHMISAKSFDGLCKEMLENSKVHGGDDMYEDVYPHGARLTVSEELTATNIVDGANRK